MKSKVEPMTHHPFAEEKQRPKEQERKHHVSHYFLYENALCATDVFGSRGRSGTTASYKSSELA